VSNLKPSISPEVFHAPSETSYFFTCSTIVLLGAKRNSWFPESGLPVEVKRSVWYMFWSVYSASSIVTPAYNEKGGNEDRLCPRYKVRTRVVYQFGIFGWYSVGISRYYQYQYRRKIRSVLSVLRTYKKYAIYSNSYTDTAIFLKAERFEMIDIIHSANIMTIDPQQDPPQKKTQHETNASASTSPACTPPVCTRPARSGGQMNSDVHASC